MIEPLVLFITERLSVIHNAVATANNLDKANEEYGKMGSQAFKTYFKQYRAEMAVLHPDMGWRRSIAQFNPLRESVRRAI